MVWFCNRVQVVIRSEGCARRGDAFEVDPQCLLAADECADGVRVKVSLDDSKDRGPAGLAPGVRREALVAVAYLAAVWRPRVIIRVDLHEQSATIEVVDDREKLLGLGSLCHRPRG